MGKNGGVLLMVANGGDHRFPESLFAQELTDRFGGMASFPLRLGSAHCGHFL
jgi:hypothetical protein